MSITLGSNTIRRFAYEVGKAVGSVLSEEEQQKLVLNFKGRRGYGLTGSRMRAAWREFATFRIPNPEQIPLQRRSYNWGDVPSIVNDMANFIQDYMDSARAQARIERERDPRLPDHVFESAMVKGDEN